MLSPWLCWHHKQTCFPPHTGALVASPYSLLPHPSGLGIARQRFGLNWPKALAQCRLGSSNTGLSSHRCPCFCVGCPAKGGPSFLGFHRTKHRYSSRWDCRFGNLCSDGNHSSPNFRHGSLTGYRWNPQVRSTLRHHRSRHKFFRPMWFAGPATQDEGKSGFWRCPRQWGNCQCR